MLCFTTFFSTTSNVSGLALYQVLHFVSTTADTKNNCSHLLILELLLEMHNFA